MQVQQVSLVLPTSYAAGSGTLASNELIGDVLVHTSIDIAVSTLQEKTVQIMATEVATAMAAVPGPLWCWVELSPYPSANNNTWPAPLPSSILLWAAIGGGGGASWATLGLLPPLVYHTEVSGLGGFPGLLIHPTIILPWTIHSAWARVVVQTPVAVALPAAYWSIQVLFSGKTS